MLAFTSSVVVEREISDISEVDSLRRDHDVVWVNVDGLKNSQTVKRLGEMFGFHVLALEDVVNTHQRVKVEAFENYLFIVARMISGDEDTDSEQISLFLTRDAVVTFQERPGDCLEPVRDRIRKSRGRIRKHQSDYLAYSILDAVVDAYFPAAERYAEKLDEIEDDIANGRHGDVMSRIHNVRNDLLLIRRTIRPYREALNQLVRDESTLITEPTRIFLRDCRDHVVQLGDLLDTYRTMCADLRDYHLSAVSNRMNEIMKVLTIIATIFIPLGFIAGIYGMNFDSSSRWNMPELSWKYGYPIVLTMMSAVAGTLLFVFWRKGWIGK